MNSVSTTILKSFSQIDHLFSEIEKYEHHINNNCFEWLSEAYGIKQDANKLTITKNRDNFTIKFFQNPNNKFNFQNICAICFCLNGSKNQEIANSFSRMLLDYINSPKETTKTLIKKYR